MGAGSIGLARTEAAGGTLGESPFVPQDVSRGTGGLAPCRYNGTTSELSENTIPESAECDWQHPDPSQGSRCGHGRLGFRNVPALLWP